MDRIEKIEKTGSLVGMQIEQMDRQIGKDREQKDTNIEMQMDILRIIQYALWMDKICGIDKYYLYNRQMQYVKCRIDRYKLMYSMDYSGS